MSMEDGGHLHELLESLEAGALALERSSGSDPAAAIHRLFQSAHNLKSGLAMAGLGRASKLLHGLEDGLDDIRRGRAAWSTAWADGLLEAVDRVKTCLDLGNDDELDWDLAIAAGDSVSPAGVAVTSEEASAAAGAAEAGLRLFRIEKLFLPGLSRQDFEGHLIYDDIADSGTLLSVKPGWDVYSQATGEVVIRFLFTSARSAEELSQLFFDPLIELPVPGGTAPSGPRFRILVLEDDPLTAELVLRSLGDAVDVDWAEDGPRGVALFSEALESGAPYDVVICDLEMPGADGHAALEAMREAEEERGILGLDRCLVFMNTSSRDFEKVRRSFRLQADAYFIKPLSVGKIQKKLEDSAIWLQNRRRGQKQ